MTEHKLNAADIDFSNISSVKDPPMMINVGHISNPCVAINEYKLTYMDYLDRETVSYIYASSTKEAEKSAAVLQGLKKIINIEQTLRISRSVDISGSLTPRYYQLGKGLTAQDVIDRVAENSGYSHRDVFAVGNVLKYIIRAPRKNGLEDLKKARQYLNRLIDQVDADE